MKILGVNYEFDRTKDQLLRRGLIDPYLLSPKDDEWIVLDEYIFWSARYQTPIVIPRWFISDLASIPKPIRWLIPVNDRHRIASLLHDFGYALGRSSSLTRLQWDLIFDDFNKFFKVGLIRRKMIQSGLFIGGWMSHSKSRIRLAPRNHRIIFKKSVKAFDLNLEDSPLLIT